MGVLSTYFGGILGLWIQYLLAFIAWLRGKSPKTTWLARLRDATSYEEWARTAEELDSICGHDRWRESMQSSLYSWEMVLDHKQRLKEAMEDPLQHHVLPNLIRSALTRNLGNITSAKLFHRAFAGTKILIEDYVHEVGQAIEKVLLPGVASGPQRTSKDAPSRASSTAPDSLWSIHDKKTTASDFSRSFGHTSLILQGGSVFGMCHLGVVKALYEQKLLPRVITGTATGALIAALVAVHTDEELPGVFSGERIDLSAFSANARKIDPLSRWSTLWRRLNRFLKRGYLLDVEILEQLVRDNVGDMTFQEAFKRTGRVLNITVVTSGHGGLPTVLNHLSAPNVLIWTAAAASNAYFPSLYERPTRLLWKRYGGKVEPWGPPRTFLHFSQAQYTEQNSPIRKIGSQFNVNHYIVSQARAYMLPFLLPDMHGPLSAFGWVLNDLFWYIGLEMRHRLRQLDRFRLVPGRMRRFVIDDVVPSGRGLTVVPDVRLADFGRLLEVPTKASLAYWIKVGEKSVWPAVAAIRVRCHVELVIERAINLLNATVDLDAEDTVSATVDQEA